MGIEDRDYYRKKYKRLNRQPDQDIRNTGLKYLLICLGAFAVLWYAADHFINARYRLDTQVTQISTDTQGSIILKADRQGHFRGTLTLNHIPMPFMIDTGATQTVIPENLAKKAELDFLGKVRIRTAGGNSYAHLTRLKQLDIANVSLNNLSAYISPHIDEVLIGMNTLKYFRITQQGNTLLLQVNDKKNSMFNNENDNEEIYM